MRLPNTLSQRWRGIQKNLFSYLEEDLGKLNENQRKLVATLEIIRVEELIQRHYGLPGRPPRDRIAIACAFVAKALYNLQTTRQLLDRLEVDLKLRRICGWERKSDVPSESKFSRVFAEFAESELSDRVHAALIERSLSEQLIGHISRDSTKIEAREKPQKKARAKAKKAKKKRGRPKRGEERIKEPTRLERQRSQSLKQMLQELPKACDVGCKRNSKGYIEKWIGYKLHIDVADGEIPVSCILTSASVHDSQVALPLAETTKRRVTNLYDLMDPAYDAPIIREHSKSMGHVPIIEINTRRNAELKEQIAAEAKRFKALNFKRPEDVRYNERTSVERVNGRLKDEFGGRTVRVRGHAKVKAHLMFAILALTADQLLRLVM